MKFSSIIKAWVPEHVPLELPSSGGECDSVEILIYESCQSGSFSAQTK